MIKTVYNRRNAVPWMKVRFLYLLFLLGVLSSCGNAKLSTADAQFARGEFFDAAATYRKVYAKTSPRKERALREKLHIKWLHAIVG